MEDYFEIRIKELERKIEKWNSKNFFQRLFSKDKWSDEDTFSELEKIFIIEKMNEIESKEDFDVYLKYYLEYYKGLSYKTSISINEKLIALSHFNPKIKVLLMETLNAQKASQHYNQQTIDLLNSIR